LDLDAQRCRSECKLFKITDGTSGGEQADAIDPAHGYTMHEVSVWQKLIKQN
jgi:hypothetical protein